MTTYAVTGAPDTSAASSSGTAARGVPATDVVALARTPEKAADLGVPVRPPTTPTRRRCPRRSPASTSCSSSPAARSGKRLPQHTAVIEAAKAAGVQRVALHEHRERRPQREPARARAQGHRGRAARLRAALHDPARQLVPRELHGTAAAVPRDGRGPRDRRRRPHRRRDPRGHGGRDHHRAARRGHGGRHVRALRAADHPRRARRDDHGGHGHQGRLPRASRPRS